MLKKILLLFFLLMATSLQLSALEKKHFTIAIDPEYIPFTQRDINGKATGLLVDFWNLWAKANNYTVSYQFYPWEETLEATKRGEVDFHSGTTKDREWMHASDPIYELATALFVRNNFSVTSTRDLVGKKIGTIDEYYGQLVKEVLGDSVEIVLYDDYPPLVEALQNHKIDALVDDVEAIRYFLIKTGQMNQFRRVKLKELQFINEIYAITNERNSVLLPQLNAGLKNIDLLDLVHVEEVWLPKIEDAYYNKKLSEKIVYTSKEKQWIAKQKHIVVTGDPSWKLSDKIEEDKAYRGVAGEYISRFEKKMHTKAILNPIDSWAEILATPESDSADVVMGTMNHDLQKLLEKRYTFLKPYSVGPLVIITDKNMRFVTDLNDIKDKRIGMLGLQNYTSDIEQHYEAYDFYYFSQINRLLHALLLEKVDAVVLPLPEAILALADTQYEQLDIIGKLDRETYVNIGVLKSKPSLKNIMNKVILSINYQDKKEILSKWTQKLNYIEKIDYKLIFIITGILGILLLSAAYYAYFIKKEHEHEKELSKQLEVLALKDALTGLLNKRAFNQKFEAKNPAGQKLGLLFIDVDNFKTYNDYYGHLEGDFALKKIADILKRFESGSCFPYRIGGEEFGFLLEDYDEVAAVKFAQSLCESVEAEKIEHSKSPFGYITVSIGIGIEEDTNMDRQHLYLTADKALYRAKFLGKNQVIYEKYTEG